MKKILLLLIGFWGSLSLSLKAQNTASEGIDKAIKNYFEGYLTGDMRKLTLALDTTSAHLYATKVAEGKNITVAHKLNEVVKRWVSNVQKKPYSEAEIKESYYKILYLDITDDKAAIAKIEIKLGQKLYIDYLSLYRLGDTWKIISKTFVQK